MCEPSIVRRLEKLENGNRRWKLFGTLGFFCFFSLLLIGATAPTKPSEIIPEIRTRQLTVFDGAGKPRAVLRTLDDGSVSLYLADADLKRNGASLRISAKGEPSLNLSRGPTFASLSVSSESSPELSLYRRGDDAFLCRFLPTDLQIFIS